jgi:3-dehydroquinate synthetase
MHRMQCESSRHYDVVVSEGLLSAGNELLPDAVGERRALVVVDHAVDALHGPALRRTLPDATIMVVELTEQTKSIEAVLEVCRQAHEAGLGRRDLIIAVGGGVVCDVVSVAASLVRRGIPYVCVPTTLVAQVDAGIGLKGAVNFAGSKSFLGSFAPPARVLVDPTLLATVSARDLRCGLAEIAKVAIVRDAALFERVERDGAALVARAFQDVAAGPVIEGAIAGMLGELSLNAYEERGYARSMDFGHTFSPLLEECSGYTLRHGEAVALDMAVSSAIGVEIGILDVADHARIVTALTGLGLAVCSPLVTVPLLASAMERAAAHRDGDLNLVVPDRIGSAAFVKSADGVPPAVLPRALARLTAMRRDNLPGHHHT